MSAPRSPPTNGTALHVPRATDTSPPHQAPATAAPAPEARRPPPPLAPAHLAWWSAPTLRELRRWVKWPGGTGRREGRQSFRTFEEILTRTPGDPGDPAPEPAMPQRALETLLRNAVQGPRNPPPVAPDHPAPGMGHRRPTALATTPPPAQRKVKGKGKARGKGTRRGPRLQALAHKDTAPGATQHRGKEPAEDHQHWERERAGATALGVRTRRRAPGRAPRKRGAPRQRYRHRPGPRTQLTPRDPQGAQPHGGTRRTSPEAHAPQDATHRVPPTEHRSPHRRRRVHPHRGGGVHRHREPLRASHNPARHPNRQATTPATFHCRGHRTDATAWTPEGEGDTATTPRTRDDTEAERQEGRGPKKAEGTTPTHPKAPGTPLGTETPTRHGTKAQAPGKGNPAVTRLTHQTERHTQTPATLTQRAAPRQTKPTGHQPAT